MNRLYVTFRISTFYYEPLLCHSNGMARTTFLNVRIPTADARSPVQFLGQLMRFFSPNTSRLRYFARLGQPVSLLYFLIFLPALQLYVPEIFFSVLVGFF